MTDQNNTRHVDRTVVEFDVTSDAPIGAVLSKIEQFNGQVVAHNANGPGGGNPQLWVSVPSDLAGLFRDEFGVNTEHSPVAIVTVDVKTAVFTALDNAVLNGYDPRESIVDDVIPIENVVDDLMEKDADLELADRAAVVTFVTEWFATNPKK